jgi:hypothetical protein
MKNQILLFVILLTLIQCSNNSVNEGIKFTGNIRNSNGEFVFLKYEPGIAGSLNFEGFINTGCKIGTNGKIDLSCNKITDRAGYRIYVKNKFKDLVLFNGDHLQMDLDMKNIDSSFFVRGKGAGKINIMQLPQFQLQPYFTFIQGLDNCKVYIDSLISSNLSLLDAIMQKDISSDIIVHSSNREAILKIVNETPLDRDEYDFLFEKTRLLKTWLLSFTPYYLCMLEKADSGFIDFSNPYFQFLKEDNPQNIELTNHWLFSNYTDDHLMIRNLQDKIRSGQKISYKDWNKFARDSLFTFEKFNDLKKSFSARGYNRYYADQLSIALNEGDFSFYNRARIDYFKNCNEKKYLERFEKFEYLLANGLNNPEYNLGKANLTLNDSSFNALIRGFKGKPLYIVLWSSRSAEAAVLPFLVSLYDMESRYQGNLQFVNICIDEQKNKPLWAAKIIDNSWKGNHYFYPMDNDKDIIKRLDCEGIFGFCEGEGYSIVDKDGNLNNNIDPPRELTMDKIGKYL